MIYLQTKRNGGHPRRWVQAIQTGGSGTVSIDFKRPGHCYASRCEADRP